MAGDLTFELDGKTYDMDDFEIGDLEWLEEYVGKPLSDPDTLNSMKSVVGIVFLIKRRDNPAFTIEEARKIKMNVFGPGEQPTNSRKRPTKAAAAS